MSKVYDCENIIQDNICSLFIILCYIILRLEHKWAVMLRIRQLEALSAVISTGSISGAASSLGISQPAMSRLISDLSKNFDFSLFTKRDGQLKPTQEVLLLYPDIERVLELMKNIQYTSSEINERTAGHLKLACLPGFATSHLPKVVAEFLKDRPEVTMTIEPDRPERILEWMVGEQYDIGITDGFSGHPSVERREINIRTVCIFPQGHHLSRLKSVSPKDLVDEKLIHSRKDSVFFQSLSQAFQEEQVKLKSSIEVRQFTSACELVSNGLGVSILSELDAIKYVNQGLEFRPFLPKIPHKLTLLRPILQRPSLIALEFMQMFETSLAPFIQKDVVT